MALLDTLLTRRRRIPRFSALPRKTRQRIAEACRDLTGAENAMAHDLGVDRPPRLMLVDEEEAVVVLATDRDSTN